MSASTGKARPDLRETVSLAEDGGVWSCLENPGTVYSTVAEPLGGPPLGTGQRPARPPLDRARASLGRGAGAWSARQLKRRIERGQAILHIHTSFSDGTATVEEILDEVEANSGEVYVVGFTHHDDVRSFFDAVRWKQNHPGSPGQAAWAWS